LEIGDTTATLGIEDGAETRCDTFDNASPRTDETLDNPKTRIGHGPATRLASVLAGWVACDPKSVEILERAKRMTDSVSTVLIRGQSGAGKDRLACILHYLGPQADEPLVKIDCTSLPSALLEQELLGHERGAFVGATQTKRGRLELAGRGTVVLDEIGGLSMSLQAKLLRVIEEKRFQRLGGSRTIEVDARIIGLTGIDLERAVARHSFREDLYYRLNVVTLSLPALRDRPRDIRPLAFHLLERLAEIHRKPQLSLSQEALAALERYSFPGNVRELKNILEQVITSGVTPEIMLQDLPPHVRKHAVNGNGHSKSLEDVEREYIAEVLDSTRGKKTRAAAILGISRKTLLEKRKRYGLG
jgi:two-component system response regulator AtoC